MNRDDLERWIGLLERGECTREQFLEQLARLPFQDLGDARVDTHRALRGGMGEVILGQGKTADQIARIANALLEAHGHVLVTRVEPETAAEVRAAVSGLEYHALARLLTGGSPPEPDRRAGRIAVVSAGTSDQRVAEEAAVAAEFWGNKVERVADVGVAGLHRLLASLDVLRSARVVVVVAGMDGALPSVVGGLVSRPVIAVPTSVGYGAAFGGLAALLGMLNSCAPNVTVVNIDNGFGAAYVASLINSA